MKKLLIFLLLFSFGFAGYCAEVLVANSPTYSNNPDSGLPCSFYDVYTGEAGKTYRLVVSGSCSGDKMLWFTIFSRVTLNGADLFSCLKTVDDIGSYSGSAEHTITLTANSVFGLNIYDYESSFFAESGQLAVYEIVVLPPINDPNDPAYDPNDPNSDPDNDGIPNSEDDDDDGDGIPDVDDPDHPDYVPPSEAPIITSSLTADGVVGEFFSYTVTVTGSTPITIESFTGTTWLTLNGSILSGIHPGGGYPTEVTARLTATNAFGIDVKTLVISFLKQGIPVITSPLSVGITPGQAFSYTITATGDPVITFGASGLPAYLSYSNGVVSGIIPTDVTNFGFIISATNSLGTDTKTVTASVGGGGGTGIVDTDDDVPAINEVKAEVIKGWTQFGILWAQFITNYMEPLRTIGVDIGDDLEIYHLEKMEILSLLDSKFSLLNDAIIDVIAPMIIGIKEDTQIIQPDVATIKTNVIEINDKLTNIEAVINTLNTDTGIRLESIKGVLDASLVVQQDQLTTQESILILLDQIANPPADPPPPLMPDTPKDPVTPNYAVDFTFDKTDNSGELQEYNKTFSMFDTAFAQRDGTLPFVLVIPLSKISSLLDDVQIDFSDGVVGSLVSGLRAILASILFYITLKYWFLAVRRITD